MKKILIGLVMMFMVTGANAAVVNLTNPTVTAGPGFSVDGGAGNFAVFGASQNLITEVTLEAELTGAANGIASFTVENSQSNWSISVFDGAITTTIFSGLMDNTVHSFDLLMSASVVYQIIVSGTNAINNYVIAFDYPVSVSEVPLPAAVWLFGSVLLGGLAMRRRSQKLGRQQAVAA